MKWASAVNSRAKSATLSWIRLQACQKCPHMTKHWTIWMSTGIFTFKTKLSYLKLTNLPQRETSFYRRTSRFRASMTKTSIDCKARGTALGERNTIDVAPMILKEGLNVPIKNVKSSMDLRGLSTCTLKSSMEEETRPTEKRSRSQLYSRKRTESTWVLKASLAI